MDNVQLMRERLLAAQSKRKALLTTRDVILSFRWVIIFFSSLSREGDDESVGSLVPAILDLWDSR